MHHVAKITNNEAIIYNDNKQQRNLNIKIKRTSSAKNVGTLSSVLSMTLSWYWSAGRKRTSLRMRSSRNVRSTESPPAPPWISSTKLYNKQVNVSVKSEYRLRLAPLCHFIYKFCAKKCTKVLTNTFTELRKTHKSQIRWMSGIQSERRMPQFLLRSWKHPIPRSVL